MYFLNHFIFNGSQLLFFCYTRKVCYIIINLFSDVDFSLASDWDIRDKVIRSKNMDKYITVQEKKTKNYMDIYDRIQLFNEDLYFENQRSNTAKQAFIDQVFPPNLQSLLYLDPSNENTDVTEEEKEILKSFKWKRARDIFKKDNFLLFDKIEVNDINQGQIGNCYFLSALSSFAEYDYRYDEIFITKQKSENGCYVVRFYIEGIPHQIILDDYFPSFYNWFAGANSGTIGKDEIWVQLLEKAWAKINRSYAGTIAGLPSEALTCLTTAPCLSYIHRKYPGEKKEEMWKLLSLSDTSNYVICTNTGNNKESEALGLVRSHAYSIISAFDFGELRLVKLRNPWGKFEWKGDFSDISDKWNYYSNLKEKVGYMNSDDGVFFMTFDDFLKYFPYTFICKYENGFHYRYARVFQENSTQMTCTKITIGQNTKITIGLHQKQTRFYNKVNNYKPQMARLILAKCTRKNKIHYKYMSSSAGDNDKLYVEFDNLEPGEYHIFANVNWEYDTECSYTISTYAASPVEIEKIESEEIPFDYLEKLLDSYLDLKCSSQSNNQNVGYSSSLFDNDLGFYIIRFENKNDTLTMDIKLSCTLNDKCQFMEDPKIKCVKIPDNSHEYSVKIPPGSSQILTWRLLSNFWNCKINLSNPLIRMLDDGSLSPHLKFRSLITQRMKSLHKEYFCLDGYYFEMEINEGVLIIFFNESKVGEGHRHRIVYEKLTNLEVVCPNNGYLSISAGGFEYVYLQKIKKNEDYQFTFKYFFKKI